MKLQRRVLFEKTLSKVEIGLLSAIEECVQKKIISKEEQDGYIVRYYNNRKIAKNEQRGNKYYELEDYFDNVIK